MLNISYIRFYILFICLLICLFIQRIEQLEIDFKF